MGFFSMWRFIFTPEAREKFNSLDSEIRKRIQKKVDKIIQSGENPCFYLKPLVYEFAGYYSLHIGHYRLICEIRTTELVVLGVDVDHRRQVYGGH